MQDNQSDTDEYILPFMMGLVSESRREKANSYAFYKDTRLSIFSELMAVVGACEITGMPFNKINCTNIKGKKPEFIECEAFYSISHSDNCVVAAVGKEEIGADIEKIKPMSAAEMMDIAELVFTKNEKKYIFSQTGHLRLDAFYTLWTSKESFMKYVQKGFLIDPLSFEIKIADNNSFVEYKNNLKCNIITLFINNGYIISLCSKMKLKSENINFIYNTPCSLYKKIRKLIDF